MKSKKTKVALISLTLLCLLLLSCTHTHALPNVINVSHPSEVRIGKTFTVVVEFEYEHALDCLYGDYIWLYYACSINPWVDITGSQYFTGSITEFSEHKPASISIGIDLSEIDCTPDDTFRFRIKHISGIIDAASPTGVAIQGTFYTENYDVLITGTEKTTGTERTDGTYISFLAVILPIVATIVLLRRRRGY